MAKRNRDLDNIRPGKTECTGGCGEIKDNSNFSFYKDRKTADGYRLMVNTNCIECQKKHSKDLRNIKIKFKNLKSPDLGQPCDCCGKPVFRNWQLDHCHETAEFRGWLCKQCNTGIGNIGDTLESAKKVVAYLQKFENRKNDNH